MNLLGKAGSPAVCEDHADFARAREAGANGDKFLVPGFDRVRAKDVKWVGMLGAQDAFNLPREGGIWHGPLLAGFRRGRLRSGSRKFAAGSAQLLREIFGLKQAWPLARFAATILPDRRDPSNSAG